MSETITTRDVVTDINCPDCQRSYNSITVTLEETDRWTWLYWSCECGCTDFDVTALADEGAFS